MREGVVHLAGDPGPLRRPRLLDLAHLVPLGGPRAHPPLLDEGVPGPAVRTPAEQRRVHRDVAQQPPAERQPDGPPQRLHRVPDDARARHGDRDAQPLPARDDVRAGGRGGGRRRAERGEHPEQQPAGQRVACAGAAGPRRPRARAPGRPPSGTPSTRAAHAARAVSTSMPASSPSRTGASGGRGGRRSCGERRNASRGPTTDQRRGHDAPPAEDADADRDEGRAVPLTLDVRRSSCPVPSPSGSSPSPRRPSRSPSGCSRSRSPVSTSWPARPRRPSAPSRWSSRPSSSPWRAWGVRTLLRRRPPVAWWLTCGVVLAVSLLGPLGGTSPAAVGTLVALHLVVGATVAVGLDPRRARVRSALTRR